MTTINLKLGYFIEMGSMCYTLKQKYKGKDRKGNVKDVERTIGYLGSMNHVIERYLKEVTSDTLDGEEMDLIEYAEQVDKVIKLAVQGLDKVLSEYAVK